MYMAGKYYIVVMMIAHHTVSTLVLFIESCECTQIAAYVLVACRHAGLYLSLTVMSHC